MKIENNKIHKQWLLLLFVIALFSACRGNQEAKNVTTASPTPSVATPAASPLANDGAAAVANSGSPPTSKGENNARETNWYKWLVIPGFAFFTLLHGLSLLVAWRALQQTREIAAQQKNYKEQSSKEQRDIVSNLNWLVQSVQGLGQFFSEQQQYHDQTQAKLDGLIKQVETSKRQSESLPHRVPTPKSSLPLNQADTRTRTAPTVRPKTKFPISVANYLRDKISQANPARFRVAGHGGLEEFEHGSFVIVLDGEEIWAIPFAERFESSYDFDNVRNYYDCPKPSGGEVILLRPASVTEDATGVYHLSEKGELKIER